MKNNSVFGRCFWVLLAVCFGGVSAIAQPNTHSYTEPGGTPPYGTTTWNVTLEGRFLNPDGSWFVRIKGVKSNTGSGAAAAGMKIYSIGAQTDLSYAQQGTFFQVSNTPSVGNFSAGTASVVVTSWLVVLGSNVQTKTFTVNKPTVSDPLTTDPQPVKTSKLIEAKNWMNKRMIYQIRDSVTEEVLYEYEAQPGETWYHTVKKYGDNPTKEHFILPEGGAYLSIDSDGVGRARIFASGYETDGNPLPDADYTTNPPVYQTPAKVTGSNGIYTKGTVTSGTNPSGTEGTPGLNQVSGAGAIVHSAAAGTGGATDVSLREGLGAVVRKLGDVESAIKASNGGGATVVDTAGVIAAVNASTTKLTEIKTVLTDEPSGLPAIANLPDVSPPEDIPVGLPTAESAANVSMLEGKIPTMPSVSIPGTTSSVSVTFRIPGIGDQVMTVDFADYADGLGIFRALARAALAWMFWSACVTHFRRAFSN